MTVDYCKFNQEAAPVAAAMPSIVSWLKQDNRTSGTWYAAIDLE